MGLDENTKSAIFLAFSAFVFVAALSMGYFLFKTVSDSNEMTYKMKADTDRNITSTLKIPTALTVSGAEVRQSIYMIRDIGVDIEVDGVLYPKTLDPTTVNVSGIAIDKTYTPSYERDSSGRLTKLRFN